MSKKIVLILIGIAIIFSSITTILYYPLLNTKDFINNKFKYGFTVQSNNEVIQPNPNAGIIEKQGFSETLAVITYYNPINPIVSFAGRVTGTDTEQYTITQMQLKRTLLDYTVETRFNAFAKNLNSEQVKRVMQYDLTKTNPDPANITVSPAPSREEVERQKGSQSVEEKLTKSSAAQAELTDCRRKDANGTFATPKELRDCVNAVKEKYGK